MIVMTPEEQREAEAHEAALVIERQQTKLAMQRAARLRALLATYTDANSIIAGRDIKANLVNDENVEAPAWTNDTGNEISYNAAKLGDVVNQADYIRVTGVNYSELSHVIYTPARGSNQRYNAIYARAQEQADGKEFYQAWLTLEAPRAESMMVTRAGATRPYFESRVANYILENPEMEGYAYIMVAGRRYLGEDLIEAAKSKWAHGAELLEEVDAITSAYRKLNLTKTMDVLAATSLGVRMMHVLKKIKPPVPPCLPQGGPEQGHGGAQEKSTQDQRNSDNGVKALAAGKDAPKDEQDGGAGKGGEEGDDEGEGEGEGSGGEGGEGEQEGPGGRGQADKPDGIQIPGGKGASNEKADHSGGTDLEGLLKAMERQAGGSAEVLDSYQGFRAAARNARLNAHLAPYPWWEEGAADESTALTGRIAREFSRLVMQADPGWNYRESHGRMNVTRYAMGERDPEQLFDAWDEGYADASSIEGVLLVDISGSMDEFQDMLSGACWTIKRSYDAIGAPLTVIAFDGDGYYVYRRDETASSVRFPSLRCVGGTDPTRALQEAVTILSVSPKKKKLLTCMTDGAWYQGYHNRRGYTGSTVNTTYEGLVSSVNKLPGGVTQMIYFNAQMEPEDFDPTDMDWHGHKVRQFLKDISALPTLVRGAVSALIQAR